MKASAIVMLSVLASASSFAGPVQTPIMIGQEPELDACSGIAVVAGLRHSLLVVRAGPGTEQRKIDSLANGQEVFICDSAQQTPWVGVVYSKVQGIECGVTSPISSPRAYAGPCRLGWVSSRWVKVIAG